MHGKFFLVQAYTASKVTIVNKQENMMNIKEFKKNNL